MAKVAPRNTPRKRVAVVEAANMISIVIPHCPGEYHDRLLKRCVDSLSGYGELIVVANERNTIGFTKAVNHGLRLAKGDYIMVVNNDIVWREGSLEDLCKPRTITSPSMTNSLGERSNQFFWGCFFVLPREVYEKIGQLDEQFYLYCSDTDLVMRARQAQLNLESVSTCNIFTEGAQTTQFIDGRNKMSDDDIERFIAKWGKRPDAAMAS
jgi:GT2 family glycosyltransferase